MLKKLTNRKTPFFISIAIITVLPNLSVKLAAGTTSNSTQAQFQQISLQQGLSVSTIHDIHQDSQGFMWFATAHGTNRFDGYDFLIHKKEHNDTTSIGDPRTHAIFEDADENLWFGTSIGVLARYNRKSHSFTNFIIDPPELFTQDEAVVPTEYPATFAFYSRNTITAIAEDAPGNLWLATWGSGIAIFNKKKEEFVYVQYRKDEPNALSSNRVSSLICDNNNFMWVGTFGGGLNRYDTKVDIFKEFKSYPSSNKNNVRFSHFRHTPKNRRSLSDDRVSTLFQDSQNNIWVGTFLGGLNRIIKSTRGESTYAYQPIHFQHYRHESTDKFSLSNDNILSICEGQNQALWIGTFGGGLNRFEPQSGKFISYQNDPNDPFSISDNNITALHEDDGGVLWIGTLLGQGINKFVPNLKKFIHRKTNVDDPTSLNDNIIYAFGEDKLSNGRHVWVGTFEGGLNRFDRHTGKYEHFTHNPDDKYCLSQNHIRSILCDSYGYLWVGTFSEGLNRSRVPINRQPGKAAKKGVKSHKSLMNTPLEIQFQTYRNNPDDSHSLSQNQIRSLYETPDSTLWVCTFGGGLNKYDRASDAFTQFRFNPEDENSIPDDLVYTLSYNNAGLLWIGTYGGGLASLNLKTGEINRYHNEASNPNSLSDNRVLAILLDSDGLLWVGTDGGGLNKFERGDRQFKIFGEKEGLTDKTVYGILEDSDKNLWLSTNNGIYKYYRSKNKFMAYGVSHGLQGREYSGGAALKISDGTMFFGGINGFDEFHPKNILNNEHIPPVVLTAFTIYNKPVPFDPKNIKLSHNDNFFTFHFSALDYTNPPANKYKYKLEGFDKEWLRVNSNRRFASFTNLDPGEYTFMVQGSNSDGIWNESATSTALIVTPPFYKKNWFYFVTILSIVGAVVISHNRRVRQKVRRQIDLERIRHAENERVRKQVAEDFHDEFGHKLSGITLYIELIKRGILKNPEQVSPYLDTMAEISRNLSSGMRNFIWTLDPDVDSFFDFAFYMKDYGDHFFNKKNIGFWVDGLEEKMKTVRLPMQWRRQFTYIFKEAISGLQKYVTCENVTFRIYLTGFNYKIEIETDGRPTEAQDEFFNNLQVMMQKRADKITAKLDASLTADGMRIVLAGAIPDKNNVAS